MYYLSCKRFAFLSIFLMLFASSTYAITDRNRDDCSDNSANIGCEHPNVVSISGFRGNLTPLGRCTGSLIYKDAKKLVFLTAAHCTWFWLNQQYNYPTFKVGVSIDANPSPPNSYLIGAQAVVEHQYLHAVGQAANAWNIVNDYGLVIVKPVKGKYITQEGGNVTSRIDAMTPVALINQENILPTLLVRNQTNIRHVGYGIGVNFSGAGGGGNQGGVGPDLSTFLQRGIADDSLFNNFGGQYQQWFMGSQNLNQGENGSCGGDSGGPAFLVDDSGKGNSNWSIFKW